MDPWSCLEVIYRMYISWDLLSIRYDLDPPVSIIRGNIKLVDVANVVQNGKSSSELLLIAVVRF